MLPISVYIHVPFCIHRCGYCDFTTYAGIEDLIPAYTQAVCQEIKLMSTDNTEKLPVGTIYFGGGTPSLLPIESIELILSALRDHFQLIPALEVSLEANPGTVNKEYLTQLNALGVNRLSLGMQSANEEELAILERQHNVDDLIKAVEWSREAGFGNLNLDLIFGLPDQRMESWMNSLEIAVSLQPEHLSLYALTLEQDTPMHHKINAGQLSEPDPDLVADMYEAASDKLLEKDYIQYEISNWARMDKNNGLLACRHNMQYWRTLPYIGLGAGAHGFINHQRIVNVSSPSAYIRRLNKKPGSVKGGIHFPHTPATVQIHSIDVDTEIGEVMMMGLRLVLEGVSNRQFQSRFGISLMPRFGSQIDRLIGFELLEWIGEEKDILRLTKKGRLLGNQVFKEFI